MSAFRSSEFDALIEEHAILATKYRLDRMLGSGGMGVVCAATHLELDEIVAVKLLGRDAAAVPGMRERFVNEARATARLKGAHVARVRDVDHHSDGTPFLVMDLLLGSDLEKIAAQGTLAPELAVDYILQACEAIAEAHAVGIVHRDLKPANLFLAEQEDGTSLIKVLDFGISRNANERGIRLTTEDSILGTPAYMSPEQTHSARSADRRSDIWSLGAVLYELVEGHPPFAAESFAALCVLVAIHDPVPMASLAPPGLQRAILKCLEKDPADRWQSVGAFARAILPYGRDLHLASARLQRLERLARDRATTSPTIPPAKRPSSEQAIAAIRDARARVAMPALDKERS